MIPTLERKRQGNQDLKLILSYIVLHIVKKNLKLILSYTVFEASLDYL